MRTRAWLAAVAVVAAWTAIAPGDTSPDRVDRLITRLGSGAFGDREAATRELDALGANALPALRRAAGSADAETRRRAAELVERIDDRLAAARILAAATCEFKYENKSLKDAVDDFARRTGAAITLSDPRPDKFRDRKVTAATPGPVPFWDAVELLCRKADVHEWDGFSRIAGFPDAPQAASGVFMPIQGQVFVRRSGYRNISAAPSGIILRDGPGTALPGSRAGAVRIRVAPIGTAIDGVSPVGADEVIVPLQLSAEPKLHWQGAVDVRIDRAIDDRGRSLICTRAVRDLPAEDDEVVFINGINGLIVENSPRRSGPVGVRVQRGEKPGTRLTELSGSVAAQVRVAEPLAVAEAPLKAAGRTFRGKFGVTLKVTSAMRAKDGEETFGVEVHLPPDIQLFQQGIGAVQMAGQLQMIQRGVIRPVRSVAEMPSLPAGATEFQGLALEDGKDRRLTATRGMLGMSRFGQDGAVFEITATFKPADAGQEPARLVFSATRPATVEIPFTVKDIPLQ
jgi:hypothetical protein